MPRDLAKMARGKLRSVTGNKSAWQSALNLTNIRTVNPHHLMRMDTYVLAVQLAVSAVGALMLPRSMVSLYQKGPVNSHYRLRLTSGWSTLSIARVWL